MPGFIAANVDVERKTFSILGVAEGVNSTQKEQEPIVLNYESSNGDVRIYKARINGHDDEADVVVKNGELTGEFLISGHKAASLHGHKGSFETLGQDGLPESQACFGVDSEH